MRLTTAELRIKRAATSRSVRYSSSRHAKNALESRGTGGRLESSERRAAAAAPARAPTFDFERVFWHVHLACHTTNDLCGVCTSHITNTDEQEVSGKSACRTGSQPVARDNPTPLHSDISGADAPEFETLHIFRFHRHIIHPLHLSRYQSHAMTARKRYRCYSQEIIQSPRGAEPVRHLIPRITTIFLFANLVRWQYDDMRDVISEVLHNAPAHARGVTA